MEYLTITNLKWANKEHSVFSCDVNFVGIGTLPFAPSPNDSEAHGREIYARCIAGEFGEIADYVLQTDEYASIEMSSVTQTEGAQTL